jgi:hypothetical protein
MGEINTAAAIKVNSQVVVDSSDQFRPYDEIRKNSVYRNDLLTAVASARANSDFAINFPIFPYAPAHAQRCVGPRLVFRRVDLQTVRSRGERHAIVNLFQHQRLTVQI